MSIVDKLWVTWNRLIGEGPAPEPPIPPPPQTFADCSICRHCSVDLSLNGGKTFFTCHAAGLVNWDSMSQMRTTACERNECRYALRQGPGQEVSTTASPPIYRSEAQHRTATALERLLGLQVRSLEFDRDVVAQVYHFSIEVRRREDDLGPWITEVVSIPADQLERTESLGIEDRIARALYDHLHPKYFPSTPPKPQVRVIRFSNRLQHKED